MEGKQMFADETPATIADLSVYRAVIVTGPQRSGTGICARMIAHDTGHRYIDEEDYGTKDLAAWKSIVNDRSGVVIHSPAMARWAHEAGDMATCVVWMIRPFDEIAASQERIGWHGAEEKAKYKDILPPSSMKLSIAEVKLRCWRTIQRPNIQNWFEIQYRDLSAHPLWVADREGFEVRQWKSAKNQSLA